MLAVLLALGCARAPAPTGPRLYVDGVRQRPLSEAEVEARLRLLAPRLENCYRAERLNLRAELSSFLFEISVPVDGDRVGVELVKASHPKQVALRDCMIGILSSLTFTSHVGEPITLRVPVRALRQPASGPL